VLNIAAIHSWLGWLSVTPEGERAKQSPQCGRSVRARSPSCAC
jgi:hypothetical protein